MVFPIFGLTPIYLSPFFWVELCRWVLRLGCASLLGCHEESSNHPISFQLRRPIGSDGMSRLWEDEWSPNSKKTVDCCEGTNHPQFDVVKRSAWSSNASFWNSATACVAISLFFLFFTPSKFAALVSLQLSSSGAEYIYGRSRTGQSLASRVEWRRNDVKWDMKSRNDVKWDAVFEETQNTTRPKSILWWEHIIYRESLKRRLFTHWLAHSEGSFGNMIPWSQVFGSAIALVFHPRRCARSRLAVGTVAVRSQDSKPFCQCRICLSAKQVDSPFTNML